MKPILIIFVVLTFIVFAPEAPAMFGHVHTEQERRQLAERLVSQERQVNTQLTTSNQRLHVTISILSASVFVALIVGTAIGRKTKKDHDTNL